MITINGKTLNLDNLSNVSIKQVNGKTTINGVNVDEFVEGKTLDIQITGDVGTLSIGSCNTLTIKGNTGDVESTNGDITVQGDVSGNVETTNGNIEAKNIHGKAKTTNGNIKANTIHNK